MSDRINLNNCLSGKIKIEFERTETICDSDFAVQLESYIKSIDHKDTKALCKLGFKHAHTKEYDMFRINTFEGLVYCYPMSTAIDNCFVYDAHVKYRMSRKNKESEIHVDLDSLQELITDFERCINMNFYIDRITYTSVKQAS